MKTPITPAQLEMLNALYEHGARHELEPVAEPGTVGPKEGFSIFQDPTGFNVCLLPCNNTEIQATARFMRQVWNLWPEILAALQPDAQPQGDNGSTTHEVFH